MTTSILEVIPSASLLDGQIELFFHHLRKTAAQKLMLHTSPHGAALTLLWRVVDHSIIAHCLGYESTKTTQIYLPVDLRLKERVLTHCTSSALQPERFQPPDP